MSMCKKILIPMAAVAVVCAAVVGMLGVLVVNLFVGGFNDEQLSRAHGIAEAMLEDYIDSARRAAAAAAEDTNLTAAMRAHLAGGARQPLVETAAAIMHSTGVDMLTVTDAAGTVLARGHDADTFGDSLAWQSNVQNALQGRPHAGIEEGGVVRLAARCGTPVYGQDGRLIGALSLGYRLDQNTFVDHVKQLTGTEVSVFLGDTRVATTILNENGERAIGTQASAEVRTQVLNGDDYIGNAMVLGKKLYTNYSPLRNAENAVVGMLFVGMDTAATEARMAQDTLIMIGVVLFLGALSVLVSWNISARLSRPIIAISNGAKQLAAGDVDIELNIGGDGKKTKDEVVILAKEFRKVLETISSQTEVLCAIADGDYSGWIPVRSERDVMNRAINRMIGQNNEVLAEVNASASQVSIGARRIADGAQSLAHGSTQQAAAIQQLSASISGIAEQTKQNAEMAREASSLSSTIKSNVEAGSVQMGRMMQAVREISDAGSRIENVIKVINDIAGQTSLLALNATIEAARAGQHGKGFAVVAQEVRNLAAKSADAAKHTSELIKNSIEKAGLGFNIATETSGALKKIVESISRNAEIAAQIAESFDVQASAVLQINTGIEQVAQVVHNNNATAQESAAASEQMSVQSYSLARMMARFKLKEYAAALGEQAAGGRAHPLFEDEVPRLCAPREQAI